MLELDDAVRDLRNVGIQRLPEAGDAGDDRVRNMLEAEMKRDHRGLGSAGRPARFLRSDRRMHPRRLALGGAVAVAALVTGLLGIGGGGVAPPSALAATMNRLAHIAASQDWSGFPGPGQYLYTETEGAYGDSYSASTQTCAYDQLAHRQAWVGSDNVIEARGPARGKQVTSAANAADCASLGIQDASSLDVNNQPIERIADASGSFPSTVAGWQALTTDPATLLQNIHRLDGGDNTPAEEFVNVNDALREIPVPLASLQALYRAVALIPGVKLMGPQTDGAGQSGLGVEITAEAGYTSEMIFDQQTGRLLGDATYDASGQLHDENSYVVQKIVDSAPPTN